MTCVYGLPWFDALKGDAYPVLIVVYVDQSPALSYATDVRAVNGSVLTVHGPDAR